MITGMFSHSAAILCCTHTGTVLKDFPLCLMYSTASFRYRTMLGKCPCTGIDTHTQYLAKPLSKVASSNVSNTQVPYKLHTLLLNIPVETPKGNDTVP